VAAYLHLVLLDAALAEVQVLEGHDEQPTPTPVPTRKQPVRVRACTTSTTLGQPPMNYSILCIWNLRSRRDYMRYRYVYNHSISMYDLSRCLLSGPWTSSAVSSRGQCTERRKRRKFLDTITASLTAPDLARKHC
jgi:hypothetical protein